MNSPPDYAAMNPYENTMAVDYFLLHLNENIHSILRRRQNFNTFLRENAPLLGTSQEICSCCNYTTDCGSDVNPAINQDVTDTLVYRFACLLNNANTAGLGFQVDIYYNIGELAMVLDYSGDIGAIPHYLFDRDRAIRMCLLCYSNLSSKMQTFMDRHNVDCSEDDTLTIKQPEE